MESSFSWVYMWSRVGGRHQGLDATRQHISSTTGLFKQTNDLTWLAGNSFKTITVWYLYNFNFGRSLVNTAKPCLFRDRDRTKSLAVLQYKDREGVKEANLHRSSPGVTRPHMHGYEWPCQILNCKWRRVSYALAVLIINGTAQHNSAVTLTLTHAATTPPCRDL